MLTRSKLRTWFNYNSGLAPQFSYNFLNPNLDSSLTFARSGSGTYYNSSGIITTAASNTARFDYNPQTLSLNGLLMEYSSQNLSFGLTTGLGSGAMTISQNAGTSPDGTNNATSATDTNASAYHQIFQSIAISTGTAYVFSVYAAPVAGRYFTLSISGTANLSGAYACFDLQTGLVTQSGALSGGTLVGAYSQYVGNGYYRLILVAKSTSATVYEIFSTSNAGTYTPDGVGRNVYIGGTNSYLLFGSQFEQNIFPSSYIYTTSAAVTRPIDALYNSSIGGWFNATAGTMLIEAMSQGGPTVATWLMQNARCPASLGDGSGNNAIQAIEGGNTSVYYGQMIIGGSANNSNGTLQIPGANTPYQFGISYTSGANNFSATGSLDTAGAFGTSALPSGVNQLVLGAQTTSGNEMLYGWLRKFLYYNTALTTTQLTTLTGQL